MNNRAPGHIALLGDSIFDNASYVRGEPDVISYLRSLLPNGWRASLYAADGSRTIDLAAQIARVPSDVTHLVISIGGNDALLNTDLVHARVTSAAETLGLIAERVAAFESAYRAAIHRALSLRRDTTLCTIYEGNLEPDLAPLARIALMPFNDAILRAAFENRLSVIDLRFVCNEPADYANPIEPSGRGGKKIAQAIVGALGLGHGEAAVTRVHVG